MELTIILTSWNRPELVVLAIESVLAQTSPHWRLVIQDDDSKRALVQKLKGYALKDERISLRKHTTKNREQTSRYAVLINEVLPLVETEIVGYMCNNVEYHPEMVESVLAFFEAHPEINAGYIYHQRDVWAENGRIKYKASEFGQPDYLPATIRPITQPLYKLDHSQVFHRMPIEARWNESREVVRYGDGVFFEQLVKEVGPIHAIRPGHVLSMEHLPYESLHKSTT